MMKKLAWILVILLLVPAFSSCAQTDYARLLDPANPVPVTIWHYYNGEQMVAFDTLVTRFNETVGAEKGIVVDAFSQGSTMELRDKVLESAEGKVGAAELPDIFGAYADTAYAVRQRDMLADFSKYLSKEELEAYVPAYLEEGKDEKGGYYLFPIAKSTEMLVIDAISWEAMAQEANISDTLFSTWEGLAQAAEAYYNWTDALTPEPNDGKAFVGQDALANYMLIGAYQLGQEIIQVKDGVATFNLDEDTMRRIWDNYYVPFVKGYYGAEGRFRSDDVKSGIIIGCVCSSTGGVYFPNSIELADGSRQELAPRVYPVPGFEGKEKVAVQQGAGMVITKSTEQKEYAATVFLKWFTEIEQNIPFSLQSGYLPVRKDANSREAIEAAVQTFDEAPSAMVMESVLNGIETVNNYTLYTSKAFDKGNEARDTLQAALADTAQADALAVREAIANGTDREAALAPYLDDAYFAQWLESLRAAMNAL